VTTTPAEPLTDERLEEIRAHVDEYGLGAPSADAVAVELIAEVDRLRAALRRAEAAESGAEWGLRTTSGYVLGPFPTREIAASHALNDKNIVRRTATYGPWTTEETNA
jgi:hypothetical protein